MKWHMSWICVLLAILGVHGAGASGLKNAEGPAPRIEFHLFGGDMTPGAPLASWYKNIGITDVWLYPVNGAFPQDQPRDTQLNVAQMEANGILATYRKNNIHFWWFERPVPDYMYYVDSRVPGAPRDVIWSSSATADARWKSICDGIRSLYGGARNAGFEGIVYDTEAYYSYKGQGIPWLWQGHEGQLGPLGNYYLRGKQVGDAILSVWPNARVMLVYSFGYLAEYWWYKGLQDSGVDVFLAIEHTYGAGPAKAGDHWYQHWWRPGMLAGVVSDKRSSFDFIPDDRHIVSGLFPIDFGTKNLNYEFRYFMEQISQARRLSGGGPFAVWIWPQGPFTPDSWQSVAYPEGVSANDYFELMRSSSLQN